MSLKQRIPKHDTIGQFHSAARQRFEEAKNSANGGDRLIGIYLCGYATEMLLKAAYFRLAGKKPTESVTKYDLTVAKGYAITKLNITKWKGGNLHDLTRWAELLIEERKARKKPYPTKFANELFARVKGVHANWSEEPRYHDIPPLRQEVTTTFQAVAWLMSNYPYL